MKKQHRQESLLNIIKNHNYLSTKEFYKIAKGMGIVEITARRDLYDLQKSGYIQLAMGMINIIDPNYEVTRKDKRTENIEEKSKIALSAVELLNDNEIIYVSPGTTSEIFTKTINKPVSTFVTNGLAVFMAAKNNQFIRNCILIGGQYRPRSGAFVGRDAITVLNNYNFTKGFFTGTNIDSNLDIFNNNDTESIVFISAISKTQYKIGLFDYTKFNTNGLSYVSPLKNLDLIITNEELDKDIKDKILLNCELITI